MYNGKIKKSRTLDLLAVSTVLDAAALGFMAYTPEQLGVTIPAYMGLRIALTAGQAYLRFKTTGAVGEKPDAS